MSLKTVLDLILDLIAQLSMNLRLLKEMRKLQNNKLL